MELQAVKAPHIKENENVRTMFGDVCLALIPLVAMSIYYYHLRALVICLVSVTTCFLADIFCLRIQGKKAYGNFSGVITGLIIAVSMPASVPYYVVIAAGLFAILVAKHPFGGMGNNIFNPACAGIVFSTICWKDQMLLFPRPADFDNLQVFGKITAKLEPAITSSLNSGSMPNTAFNNMIFGNFRGPMGATSILVILGCAVYLLYRKSISWFTPVSFAVSLTVFSIVFTAFDLSNFDSMSQMLRQIPLIAVYEFCAGSALFAAIFIATDPVTTPTFWQSKLLHGLGLGFLTVFFRRFGQHSEGVFAAVLAMNSISGFLDKLILDYQMDNSIIKRFKERQMEYHQSDEYVALLATVEGERQIKAEKKEARRQSNLEKQTQRRIELEEKRKKQQEERERRRAEEAERKRIEAEKEAERKRIEAEKEAERKRIEAEEAEKKRIADEEAAEKKRIADEEAAEKKRIADEEAAEKERLADEEAAEKKRLADEEAAEKKRLADEENKSKADEVVDSIAEVVEEELVVESEPSVESSEETVKAETEKVAEKKAVDKSASKTKDKQKKASSNKQKSDAKSEVKSDDKNKSYSKSEVEIVDKSDKKNVKVTEEVETVHTEKVISEKQSNEPKVETVAETKPEVKKEISKPESKPTVVPPAKPKPEPVKPKTTKRKSSPKETVVVDPDLLKQLEMFGSASGGNTAPPPRIRGENKPSSRTGTASQSGRARTSQSRTTSSGAASQSGSSRTSQSRTSSGTASQSGTSRRPSRKPASRGGWSDSSGGEERSGRRSRNSGEEGQNGK